MGAALHHRGKGPDVASKTFHINTEPHDVTIGGKTLLFEPEIIGAEFASALKEFQDRQDEHAATRKEGQADDASALVVLEPATRDFLRALMLPESRETFATMRIPLRVLTEMVAWVVETYGGGQGNDPGTSASDSS